MNDDLIAGRWTEEEFAELVGEILEEERAERRVPQWGNENDKL